MQLQKAWPISIHILQMESQGTESAGDLPKSNSYLVTELSSNLVGWS